MKETIRAIGIVTAPIFLILMMFFIPISSTILNVCLALGSLTLISIAYYRSISYYTWFSLSGALAITLFAYVIIASLWSPAPFAQQFTVISKYFKLFYLPIVAVSFINPKMRYAALNAFLLAILVNCLLSINKYFQLLPIIAFGDTGEVFFNHIITSFMIAFGSYLSALFVFRNRGWKQGAYLLLFLISSYQILFINTGRMGYIIYTLLMLFLIVQQLTPKQACLAILGFLGIIYSCYHFSPSMNSRLNNLFMEVELIKQDKMETSVGYRVEFHRYAKKLLKEKPLLGVGTGGFKYRYAKDNPVPSWGSLVTEPHSQFWFLLAEHGVIGFALFIGFLLSLVKFSFKQLQEMRPILLGFILAFVVGCISDTLFSFSVVGYLFIMIIAICYGEYHELRENKAAG